MEPKIHKTRQGLDVVDVNDTPEDVFMDDFLEDGGEAFVDELEPDTTVKDDQKRRIESLKRAIDIAKLMSNVTTDDVINIAGTIEAYIKDTQV